MPTLPNFQAPATTTTNKINLGLRVPEVIQQAQQYPPLSLPICFGLYKKFNYTTCKKVQWVCVRILTHLAVKLADIEYAWITPSVLKLVIYWLEWLTFAEQIAMSVINETSGEPLHPSEHPPTKSFANNTRLAVEDGRIMDEGYILFEKDMREDSFQIERLKLKIGSKDISVRGIQIFAEVDTKYNSQKPTQNKVQHNCKAHIRKGPHIDSNTRNRGNDMEDGDKNGCCDS